MNKNLQQMILVTILVLLSVGAAIGLRAWLHPPLHLQAAELLAEPIAMQNQGYNLTVNKVAFNMDMAKGYWLLLYPANMKCQQQNTQVLQELGKMLTQFDGVDAQYKPLVSFVDLYPEQNAVGKPAMDAQQFHKDIQYVSAEHNTLARLANVFGFSYDKNIETTTTCPVNDLTRIYILDPQLRYIGSFVPPHHDDTLYSDMQQLTHQLWRYHIQR